MIDILMFPIGFLIGLAVFHAVEGLRTRHEPCDTFVRAKADSLACVRIVGMTPSNNNFPPMEDSLSDFLSVFYLGYRQCSEHPGWTAMR